MLPEIPDVVRFLVPENLKIRARKVMGHGEMSEYLRAKLEEEVTRREANEERKTNGNLLHLQTN